MNSVIKIKKWNKNKQKYGRKVITVLKTKTETRTKTKNKSKDKNNESRRL